MAYENFTTFYNVASSYIPGYDNITTTMGVGPFPYTDIVPSISIKSTGSYDWPYCGRACSIEGSDYDLSYVADIVAYDPTDSTRYAVCNTVHPTLSKLERGSGKYYHKGYLKLEEQAIDLPLSVSAWTFHGGLSALSKELALAIVVKQTNFSTDLSNYVNVRMGTGTDTWLQYEHTIISERYANTIDTYPIFADRSTKDANGDQIDTTYLKSADVTAVKKTTASLPPVSTRLSELEFFTDGRVRGDSADMGLLVPYPSKSDSGKILQAVWAGSPAIGSTIWAEKPTVVDYIAGTGLTSTVDSQTGDVTFAWAYTVGRNLEVNPYKQICTSIPGALGDASTKIDATFHEVTNGKFAGAYVLMTRQNADNTYNIGIRYTASGTSSTISFVGTETVIANDNTMTVNPAVYMNQKVTYTGNKFGTTTFNPATHKAIYYSGLAMIGPLSDTKIAIFKDAGDYVKVAFTSVEAKMSW